MKPLYVRIPCGGSEGCPCAEHVVLPARAFEDEDALVEALFEAGWFATMEVYDDAQVFRAVCPSCKDVVAAEHNIPAAAA